MVVRSCSKQIHSLATQPLPEGLPSYVYVVRVLKVKYVAIRALVVLKNEVFAIQLLNLHALLVLN